MMATYLEDQGQLVDLILAWEERFSVVQLSHDATDSPDICRLSIPVGQ